MRASPGSRHVWAALALVALASACGDDAAGADEGRAVVGDGTDGGPRRSSLGGPRGGVSSGGGSGTGSGGDEGGGDAPSPPDAGPELPATCDLPDRPIDVIFVIDTSGSMAQEIVAIQENINRSFAAILDREGVDYRVILIGTHGISDDETLRICISSPLSGASCAPVPEAPQNTERFRHYSSAVGSFDPLCQILDTFTLADEFGLAPNGWSAWLREGALKVFVLVTDDSAGCASATSGALFSMADDPDTLAMSFDTELRKLSARQFQEPSGMPGYKWYSMVGLAHSARPVDPLVEAACVTAPTPGLSYQALSRLTGSMRYPVCEGTSFPQAFTDIAAEVVDEALPCQGP